LFSVVITTYKRPVLLAEAVESVLAQTLTDFECIVVDDASPEPPTLPDDPRVRLVVREVNGGEAAARNTGIDAALGTYVAFLDDDDLWLPTRLADAAEAHKRAPIAVCWQATLGSNAPPSGRVLEGDVRDTVLDGMTPNFGAMSIERTRARVSTSATTPPTTSSGGYASPRSCASRPHRTWACCTACTASRARVRARPLASTTRRCCSNNMPSGSTRTPERRRSG